MTSAQTATLLPSGPAAGRSAHPAGSAYRVATLVIASPAPTAPAATAATARKARTRQRLVTLLIAEVAVAGWAACAALGFNPTANVVDRMAGQMVGPQRASATASLDPAGRAVSVAGVNVFGVPQP